MGAFDRCPARRAAAAEAAWQARLEQDELQGWVRPDPNGPHGIGGHEATPAQKHLRQEDVTFARVLAQGNRARPVVRVDSRRAAELSVPTHR
jgi:hypothetical protein